MSFIDTYRQLQDENTAQIGEAAHALGSDLTAQYGGLHGPSEYIKSRYQTPQTESRIAGLKSAAQLSALNQIMQNEQDKWKNRYNQAYRNYQKRAYNASKAGSSGSSGNGAVQASPYEEYSAQDTLGISSGDWSSQNLPEGAQEITRVSANGAYSNGYPAYYDTTETGEVVSSYGVPTAQANGTDNLLEAFNLPQTAWNVAQFTANPISAIGNWTGQAIRNLFGGQ